MINVQAAEVVTWAASLGAWSTLGAAVFAAAAFVVAWRSFVRQGERISKEEKLNTAQSALLTQQTKALEMQQAEIMAAQERRDKEALEQLRGQARRVHINSPVVDMLAANEYQNRTSYHARLQNMSGGPIRNISAVWSEDGRILKDVAGDHDEQDSKNKISLLAAEGETFVARKVLTADVVDSSAIVVTIDFTDANSVRWRIDNADRFEYLEVASGDWIALPRD